MSMWISDQAVGGETVLVGFLKDPSHRFELLLVKAGIRQREHRVMNLESKEECVLELPQEFLMLSEDKVVPHAQLKEAAA